MSNNAVVLFPASHLIAIKWPKHVNFVNTFHEAIIYNYTNWTWYLNYLAVSMIKAICLRNWIFTKKTEYGYNSSVIRPSIDNSVAFFSTNRLIVPHPSLRIADPVVNRQTLVTSSLNVTMTCISIDFSWISNYRLSKSLSENILYFLGLSLLVRRRTTVLLSSNEWVLWMQAGVLLVPIPPTTSKPYT